MQAETGCDRVKLPQRFEPPMADPQAETLAFLATLDGGSEVVSTHISHVVLGRTRAFKLKRAVKFPYLDFSTPELRLAMCARETRLNRRLAPTLYLGTRRITREADGHLALDGDGELVDAIVEMRRFPADALLDRRAAQGRLDFATIEALARRIAAFHDAAEVAPNGGAEAMRRVLAGCTESLRQAPPAHREEIDAHVARLAALLDAHAGRLDARHAADKTRHCHGDLILRNICLWEGAPTPFDCIEFSDEIARIDTLYDLAFLLMDLWRVGLPAHANAALNRYLDRRDEADGLPLLPFFMALRATIRAHVAAAQGAMAEARQLFDLARTLAVDATPLFVAIGGYSGAGKSSVAAALAWRLGAPPGARTLASDRLRKKRFGAEPTERLPPEAYTSAISAEVYAEMGAEAARIAAHGWPVVVDAVFDLAEPRVAIEQSASAIGAPFFGFWLDAGLDHRIARVEARRGDPSDATPDVLRGQMQKEPGAIEWRRLDATQPAEALAAEIARLIGAP
jgi:aminoglycoside phosphotransferase family enzyme/predicted kinase